MNISINFSAPSLGSKEYFSIIKIINEYLNQLSGQIGNIKSAEIKLDDTMEDSAHNNKAVLVNIKLEKRSFIEYRVANEWNEMITDVFSSLIGMSAIGNANLVC